MVEKNAMSSYAQLCQVKTQTVAKLRGLGAWTIPADSSRGKYTKLMGSSGGLVA